MATKNINSNLNSNEKVHQILTDRVVEALKKGVIPWEKPWFGTSGAWGRNGGGKPYSILNQLCLPEGGEYITFNQITKEGGHLNKGAESSIICFYKVNRKDYVDAAGQPVLDDNGKPKAKTWVTLKYYRVFRIADTDLEQRYHRIEEGMGISPKECNRRADSIVKTYLKTSGLTLHQDKQSGEAFYRSSDDSITLPLKKQFKDKALYYKTVFHEMTHSTGHPDRLNREIKNLFGSAAYAREELVAELGAATLLHRCGIFTKRAEDNSAAYIQNWLGALENDVKLIAWASVRAQKAADFIDPMPADLEGEEPDFEEDLDLVAGAGIA